MSPAAAQCLMCSVSKIALDFFMHHSSLFTLVKLFALHVFGFLETSSRCRVAKFTYMQFLGLAYFSDFPLYFWILFYFVSQLIFCVNLKNFSFTVHLFSDSFSDSVQRELLMHLNTWKYFSNITFLVSHNNISSWLDSSCSCIFLGQ